MRYCCEQSFRYCCEQYLTYNQTKNDSRYFYLTYNQTQNCSLFDYNQYQSSNFSQKEYFTTDSLLVTAVTKPSTYTDRTYSTIIVAFIIFTIWRTRCITIITEPPRFAKIANRIYAKRLTILITDSNLNFSQSSTSNYTVQFCFDLTYNQTKNDSRYFYLTYNQTQNCSLFDYNQLQKSQTESTPNDSQF
jgi:hypothetical protein